MIVPPYHSSCDRIGAFFEDTCELVTLNTPEVY